MIIILSFIKFKMIYKYTFLFALSLLTIISWADESYEEYGFYEQIFDPDMQIEKVNLFTSDLEELFKLSDEELNDQLH